MEFKTAVKSAATTQTSLQAPRKLHSDWQSNRKNTIQLMRWQYKSVREGWVQLDSDPRGFFIPPRYASVGTIFDDVTGFITPPPMYSAMGAGSGYNESLALGRYPDRGPQTVVSDLQSRERLETYPHFREAQSGLKALGSSFFCGIDASVSPVVAPNVYIPFIETGARRSTFDTPLTSEVVRYLFQRLSEEQDYGDTITMGIYLGDEAQYQYGQRYCVKLAAFAASYTLVDVIGYAKIPEHERTDHQGGLEFTQNNIVKLVFKKVRSPEEMPKKRPPISGIDDFL